MCEIRACAWGEFDSSTAGPRRSSRVELEAEVVTLYREESSALLRHAQRLAGDRELAREAVQEAFLRYFAGRLEGKLAAAGRPWLFRVVRNYIYDRLRNFDHSARAQEAPEDAAPGETAVTPETQYHLAETARRIRRLLTRREFECLSLRLQGMSYQETADALGVEIGTVASLLARALKKLRAAFAPTAAPPASEPRR